MVHDRFCRAIVCGDQERIVTLTKSDEIAGDELRPLMNQLVEGMLSVGAWFTPDDGACFISDSGAVTCHPLAVALHVELLQISREAFEVLVIRQDSVASRA